MGNYPFQKEQMFHVKHFQPQPLVVVALPLASRKTAETIAASTSETVIAHQIPSISKNSGRNDNRGAWNTSTRKKEISAETAPLPSAVKKPEQKILKPASRKENANKLERMLRQRKQALIKSDKHISKGSRGCNGQRCQRHTHRKGQRHAFTQEIFQLGVILCTVR